MRVSIRRQLLTLFVPFLFSLWAASAVLSYGLVAAFSGESFDRELISSADSVAARIRFKNGKLSADLPPAAQAILKHSDSDRFYYRVITDDGRKISGDPDLPSPSHDIELGKPHITTTHINGQEVRLVELRLALEESLHGAEETGANVSKQAVVQVAETTNVRTKFLQDMLMSIALPQLLIIGVGLSAVWYGVTKILHPLGLLQEQLASRSPSDLSPVSEQSTPQEVYPLVSEINQLLGRLNEEIKAHQRFIANAAHQLRTPLAGLKTYSSIGTEMSNPNDLKHIVNELDQGIDRASRMVNQLLALARTDFKDQATLSKRTEVDLNFIVSDVTAELIQQAVRKDISLSYEAADDSAIVFGEQTGLRHLVSNLVENALAYTPSGGTVVVRVTNGADVTLSVADSGCGIPVGEREKVLERFYRVVGSNGGGSGLGLAIVKEVANSHHATLSIDSGLENRGTKVTVKFPKNGTKPF